jgi:hypothetical protein
VAASVEQRIYDCLTQDKLKDFCDRATGLQSSVPLVRRAFAGRRGVGRDDVYEESRAIAAGRGGSLVSWRNCCVSIKNWKPCQLPSIFSGELL